MKPSGELVQQWMTEVWHEGTPVQISASDLHIAERATEWCISECGKALSKYCDCGIEICDHNAEECLTEAIECHQLS
jgi:hypothetical protein